MLFKFTFKFCLYLPKENSERKERGMRVLDYCLRVCLSRSIVLTGCCALTWVTKTLMQAISNVHAGRIWPAGRRFPTPVVNFKTWLRACLRSVLPCARRWGMGASDQFMRGAAIDLPPCAAFTAKVAAVVQGASKRRWAPRTIRDIPKEAQKSCIDETELVFVSCKLWVISRFISLSLVMQTIIVVAVSSSSSNAAQAHEVVGEWREKRKTGSCGRLIPNDANLPQSTF